jgi:hypothetical protein
MTDTKFLESAVHRLIRWLASSLYSRAKFREAIVELQEIHSQLDHIESMARLRAVGDEGLLPWEDAEETGLEMAPRAQ